MKKQDAICLTAGRTVYKTSPAYNLKPRPNILPEYVVRKNACEIDRFRSFPLAERFLLGEIFAVGSLK